MSENFNKIGKRRGFSLIVVLILSLISLAMLSGVFQYAAGSAGAGRRASSTAGKYNLLQDAAETGKAKLKEMMNNTNPPPRHSGFNLDSHTISEADDLLIDADPNHLGKGVISRENTSGGVLEVKIYDMQYDAGSVDPSITNTERIKLPPAIVLKGSDPWRQVGDIKDVVQEDIVSTGDGSTNTGAYLVRAVLKINLKDKDGKDYYKESILDTAIFQSNDE
jgi:hypothetical protein